MHLLPLILFTLHRLELRPFDKMKHAFCWLVMFIAFHFSILWCTHGKALHLLLVTLFSKLVFPEKCGVREQTGTWDCLHSLEHEGNTAQPHYFRHVMSLLPLFSSVSQLSSNLSHFLLRPQYSPSRYLFSSSLLPQAPPHANSQALRPVIQTPIELVVHGVTFDVAGVFIVCCLPFYVFER